MPMMICFSPMMICCSDYMMYCSSASALLTPACMLTGMPARCVPLQPGYTLFQTVDACGEAVGLAMPATAIATWSIRHQIFWVLMLLAAIGVVAAVKSAPLQTPAPQRAGWFSAQEHTCA